MKSASTLAFFAVLAVASSRALPGDDVSVNYAVRAPLANCIITAYSSIDCTSGALIAYDFVVDGCRSCESFEGAHSFSLGQGCPSGTFYANVGACGNTGDQFAIGFSGPGCHHVDTGEHWSSGNPCFN